MKVIVTAIPAVLQTIFLTLAPPLALSTQFIQRQGSLKAHEFALTFSLFLLRFPQASLRQLANELSISASALCQRFESRRAACFLRALLMTCLGQLSLDHQTPTLIPILKRFRGVYICDCTTVSLPKSLLARFPGCGGGSKAKDTNAAVKILIRTHLDSGQASQLKLAAGRVSDIKLLKKLTRLPRGALQLADLGFFDTSYFATLNRRGIFWLTRIPIGIRVNSGNQWEELADWLSRFKQQGIGAWDGWLSLVKSAPLMARVLIRRCPLEVSTERRRKLHARMKRNGKTASQRLLEMCDWWVMATNVESEKLSHAEASELYRTRWQIELIFKRWKSLGKLQVRADLTPDRAECELYGRLLGVLLVEWMALHRGGPLSGRSVWHAWQAVLQWLDRIIRAIAGKTSWKGVLEELAEELEKIQVQPQRKKYPSTRQRLIGKRLTA